MNRFIRKLISATTAVVMLVSATALQAFASGAATGDEYDIGGLDLSKATVKPTISITHETIAEGEYKAHPVRSVNVTIKDADGKYDNAGFSVKVDEKLKLVKDEDGDIAFAGSHHAKRKRGSRLKEEVFRS